MIFINWKQKGAGGDKGYLFLDNYTRFYERFLASESRLNLEDRQFSFFPVDRVKSNTGI